MSASARCAATRQATPPSPAAPPSWAAKASSRTATFRPAATVREILDEANAQHNCAAGFIDKYASGQTDLWLMRKASDPDRPLVTVEVRGGAIRQAFQSHNRQVTAAQRGFLADWCEAVGYRMPTGGRMRALGGLAR
ncbi:PcfJ domain-containing protein [Atopobiaceae bacterium HCP3S3_D6]